MFNPLVFLPFLALVLFNTPLAAAKVYNVTVGRDTFGIFDPPSASNASIGDTLVFHFESTYNLLANASGPASTPCVGFIYEDDFRSFHLQPSESVQNLTFTINSTRAPIYFFSITSTNCSEDLVKALNEPNLTVKSMWQYINAASHNTLATEMSIQERATPTQPTQSSINTTGSISESTAAPTDTPAATNPFTTTSTTLTTNPSNISSFPPTIPPPKSTATSLAPITNIDTSTSTPSQSQSIPPSTIQPPKTITISSTTTTPPPTTTTNPEMSTIPSTTTSLQTAGLQTTHPNTGTQNHVEGSMDFCIWAIGLLLAWFFAA